MIFIVLFQVKGTNISRNTIFMYDICTEINDCKIRNIYRRILKSLVVKKKQVQNVGCFSCS